MKMLFRQRMFSWFSSYDIYAEDDSTLFTVKGRPAWGHKLEIYDSYGQHVGTLREEMLRLLPKYSMYMGSQYVGCIRKEISFMRPRFTLDANGWTVTGDLMQWDYTVQDRFGSHIMRAEKQLMRLTDTYTIDVADPSNALFCLMIVLAIDAAKSSN